MEPYALITGNYPVEGAGGPNLLCVAIRPVLGRSDPHHHWHDDQFSQAQHTAWARRALAALVLRPRGPSWAYDGGPRGTGVG